MNEIHVTIDVRNRETGERIRELGEVTHAIVDPGEDVQSIHGWRNYVAERVALGVKATVAGELTRESVLAEARAVSGFCPRCGEALGTEELLPDPDANGQPAHVRCLAGHPPMISRETLEETAAALTTIATPEIVSSLLLLLGDGEFPNGRPTDEAIAAWTDAEREEVATWAASIHSFASDNLEVKIPAVPAVLGGSDDATRTEAPDDEGGADPSAGEGAEAPSGGEAGAAEAGAPAGEEVLLVIEGGAEDGDHGPASGGRGEAHAGSEGAEAGGNGAGKVSRPRARRSRAGQAPKS